MNRGKRVWLRLGALGLCCGMALATTSCRALSRRFGQSAEEGTEIPVPTQEGLPETENAFTVTTSTTAATTRATQDEGTVMYVVAGGGLRMREQPNTDAGIILTIPTKSQVLVLWEEGDWSYVRYNEKEGWCANAWIFRSIEEATTTAKTEETNGN